MLKIECADAQLAVRYAYWEANYNRERGFKDKAIEWQEVSATCYAEMARLLAEIQSR